MIRRRSFRLWALLAMLVVVLLALAPGSGGLSLRSGSAFSADTVEVAIAPARRAIAASVATLPTPPPSLPPVVVAPVALLPVLAAPWLPKPQPTAPPRRDAALAQVLAPRAPPRP
ncbi:hypothetical protein [Novosphingobium huizhouense]|uniref:hypothetical protein n=1 Tax=Novosphingobium huizhouense TaxID=2866625 RepID=UPI001CD8D067|nr:hypothetical protein [Novosphingobium huizhouense]